MITLGTSFAGISMKNPTMLASGMMGETGSSLCRVSEMGAGALVTKSIGLEPRYGYPNPTLVELPYGYINAMGLPGPGIELFNEEMKDALKCGVPIIGSLFAAVPDDFIELAAKMKEYGAAAVELNLSCPHAKGYGMEIGIDPAAVGNIIREVKGSVDITVIAKLTPNTHLLLDVAKEAEAAGCDCIAAINTLKAMAISVEAKRPVLFNKTGGLSGPAVKPVGLRCVYELSDVLDIPIIGVGGAETGRDVLEYIMAGASAVQIGSAVGRRGLNVFSDICSEMKELMEKNDIKSVKEIVGVAHV